MQQKLIDRYISAAAWTLILLVFGCFLWLNLKNHQYLLAYHGWSIKNLVDLKLYPNLQLDKFQIGQTSNFASLYLQFFILLSKLGIPTTILDTLGIIIASSSYFLCSACILKTYSKKISPIPLFACISLIMISSVRLCDLGNFGIGVIGQSEYASAFLFSAISFYFSDREKITSSILFSTLSILCHPIIGIFGVLWILFSKINCLTNYLNTKNILTSGIAIVMIMTWFHFFLPPTLISDKNIPLDAWLSLQKIMNYHWFPIDHQFLWQKASRKFIAFTAFLSLLFYYLTYEDHSRLKNTLIYGTLGLCFITILGLLFSTLDYRPLIRLALQRSSGFILLITTPFIALNLIQDLTNKKRFIRFTSSLILLSSFFTQGGLPILLIMARVSFSKIIFTFKKEKSLIALQFFFLITLIFAALYLLDHVGPNISSANYIGLLSVNSLHRLSNLISGLISVNKYHIEASLIIIVFTPLALLLFKNKKSFIILFYTSYVVMTFLHLFKINQIHFNKSKIQLYKNYYDAQIWAKENTPPKSIFMTSPANAYGWSDYSLRPSVGILHDWLSANWLYTNSFKSYELGIKIFSEFKTPLKNYTKFKTIKGFDFLRRKIENVYYSWDSRKLYQISSNYKISYFVFEKKLLAEYNRTKIPCRVVYQNKSYIICKPYKN